MSGRQRVEAGPAVGAGLEVDDYLEFLAKEYLAGFVRHGGAAVKVVVAGDDDVAARFHAGLAADAAAEGFVYAAVDAAATRAHLADQLFFAVAGQVDWAALARGAVRARLRAKQTLEYDELASLAEAGMRAIDRDMLLLAPPDDAELDRAYARLKELHGEAFGWDPPEVAGLERLGTTRMRQYVRAWINEWDLVRLDPEFAPQTEVVGHALDAATAYREDPDLEGTADSSA